MDGMYYRVRVAQASVQLAHPEFVSGLRIGLRRLQQGTLINGADVDSGHLRHLLAVRVLEPVTPTPAAEPVTAG
jgi:hypothetical protein